MIVYSIGANPISYTARPSKRALSVCQQFIEPFAPKTNKGLVEELIRTAKGDFTDEEKAILNNFFKNLSSGEERKLRNFDGRVKDSVYRGKNYLNRIVQSVEEPRLTFISSMENIGTNEAPRLRTTAMSLRKPFGIEEVRIQFLDEKPPRLFLEATREGYETHRASHPTWEELTSDSVFQRVIRLMTGNDFE